jgi:hypothetical protein
MTDQRAIDTAVKLFVFQHGARLRFARKNRSWYEWDAQNQWWVGRPSARAVNDMSESANLGDRQLLKTLAALREAVRAARERPPIAVDEPPQPNRNDILREVCRLQFKHHKTQPETEFLEAFHAHSRDRAATRRA